MCTPVATRYRYHDNEKIAKFAKVSHKSCSLPIPNSMVKIFLLHVFFIRRTKKALLHSTTTAMEPARADARAGHGNGKKVRPALVSKRVKKRKQV